MVSELSDEEKRLKRNEYARNYYQSHKKKINPKRQEHNRKYYLENKDAAIKSKGSRCFNCGYEYTGENGAVFDFHHVDEGSREIFGRLVQRSRNAMFKELEKCVMVCANCHRLIHYGQVNITKPFQTATEAL